MCGSCLKNKFKNRDLLNFSNVRATKTTCILYISIIILYRYVYIYSRLLFLFIFIKSEEIRKEKALDMFCKDLTKNNKLYTETTKPNTMNLINIYSLNLILTSKNK